MSYDLLIKNGIVVDGTGAPQYRADVAVANGTIAEIGKITDGAQHTVDASDLIVAPGFIDPHTHYDAQICWDPLITSSSWHGVTSLVMGNCGVGIAPCRPNGREIAAWDLVNVEAIPFDVLTQGIKWEWETFPQYMDAAAKRGSGINLGFMAPLTPFRHYVMGEESMDRAGDMPLSIPNFCSYDAEGNLYVSISSTQPGNKVFEEFDTPAPNGALVRIRPDGRGEVVATGIYFANGTAIDPNEDAVYVLESSRNDCVRIQIKKDGTFGKPEVYSSGFPAIPDGMAFDVDRNLYITLPGVPKDGKLAPRNQIIRVDPTGKWEMLIEDLDGTKLAFPTNCAFGGPGMQDLFIANLEGDHFNRVRTSFRGHPLYHQR